MCFVSLVFFSPQGLKNANVRSGLTCSTPSKLSLKLGAKTLFFLHIGVFANKFVILMFL